jgi:hypothetical protein
MKGGFLMAITKKGSRRIVVEDISYHWSVRSRPTYSQGLADSTLTFAIQLEDIGKTTLVVCTSAYRPDNWFHRQSIVVTPSIVRQCILEALEKGWTPQKNGSPFLLNYLAG